MDTQLLTMTRRSLHGAAELLLAGPQHRATGRIDLRAIDGGFATAAEPPLRIEGTDLVTATGRLPLAGRTYAEIGAAAGFEAGAPVDVYSGGLGVEPGEPISLDPDAARVIESALTAGDRALRLFAPALEPVLWPEHFDVAVTADDVNYGVSPGDDHLAEPYAYVGPFEPHQGEFWNAPFGAARTVAELGEVDDIVRFFRAGRDFLATD
jgi:hypothetical protein